MFNPMKVRNMATEEEIEKVKELDWDTYFREYHSEESMSIWNCPKCAVILVRQSGQTEIIC
jgi:ribosomal protein L37AE/L43A